MNHEWLNLLFDGNRLVDHLKDVSIDMDVNIFNEWYDSVLVFVSKTELDNEQKQVLLELIDQIAQMAKSRAENLHSLQEKLVKTHFTSRKYLQSF